MSLFNRLKDQINPFDGGKTFNSPQPGQAAGRAAGMNFGGTPPNPNNTMMGKQIQRMEQMPRMEYAQPRQAMPMQGQAQVPYSQETADRYNANPQQFSGRNAIDPKYFGYAEDRGQYQEDDGPVLSGGQIRPLSSLDQGEPWVNPQNGYSPQNAQLDRIRRLLGL